MWSLQVCWGKAIIASIHKNLWLPSLGVWRVSEQDSLFSSGNPKFGWKGRRKFDCIDAQVGPTLGGSNSVFGSD